MSMAKNLEDWIEKCYPRPCSREETYAREIFIPFDEDQTDIEYLAMCICGYFLKMYPQIEWSSSVYAEITLALCEYFPNAKSSRISAAMTYAKERWVEAFGYE